VTFVFQVDGLDEVVRWLLGWAGRARAIKTPELRRRVLAHHRKATEMNQKP
jgi:hypothetical protein